MATWKEIAFRDDVALLSTQAAHAIGKDSDVDDGVSTDASRHDHIHILGSNAVDGSSIELTTNALNVVADGITAAKLHDDAVGSEHIEQLSAALNFGGQQASNMVVMQSTIGSPPTAVVGKWFQDSSTKKFYICTAL